MGTRIQAGKVHVGMSADAPSRLTAFGRPCWVERIFMGSVGDDKTARVRTAMAAGRIPFLSIKVGTWRTAANGSVDAQLSRLADTLAGYAEQYDTDVVACFHHEPLQTPSNPTGEGGTSADWHAMWRHLVPVMRRPGLQFWPITNGWNWRDPDGPPTKGLTDAQRREWFGPLSTVVDGLAGDFYEMSIGQSSPSLVMANFAKWALANGFTALGVGEFGSPEGSGEIDKVRDLVLRSGTPWGLVCWWNSDRVGQFGLNGQRMVDMREFVAASEDFNEQVEPPPDPDPDPVPAPTNLQAVVDQNRVHLTWQSPSALTPEIDGVGVRATGSHEFTTVVLSPGTYTFRLRLRSAEAFSSWVNFPTVTVAEPDPDPDPDPDPRDQRIAELEALLAAERVVTDLLGGQVADYDHRLDTIAGIAARTTP